MELQPVEGEKSGLGLVEKRAVKRDGAEKAGEEEERGRRIFCVSFLMLLVTICDYVL